MKLSIKNMVCPRCILVIERELVDLNMQARVTLGFIEFEYQLSKEQIEQIASRIVPLGFEILIDSKNKQVEEIKNLLIKVFHAGKIEPHFSVKKYLSSHIIKEYSYLSKLFSEKEGITIEQYFILLKLEKVKELLTYGEHRVNEIAWNLGYSSVQHLSTQFKRVLGVSTRDFKARLSNRNSIDQVGVNH